MSAKAKYITAAVVAGVVAVWLLPGWLTLLVILGLVGVPVVGYLMLDPEQRRRLRRIRNKQIGS